ncbi:MAG: hypothetical protein JO033_11275 [Acidobacteriaceae bacterium]|nr:hypothetical protein [Acidobacteriaceae bacterium]
MKLEKFLAQESRGGPSYLSSDLFVLYVGVKLIRKIVPPAFLNQHCRQTERVAYDEQGL